MTFHKALDVGYALQIDVEMKAVIVTSSATTTIPDTYGKSGTTGASAGSASTTTSSDASSGSGANGSGSSGSSGSGKGESILHAGISSIKSGAGLFGALTGDK